MFDKKPTDSEIIKALKEILETMLVMGDLQKSSTISKAIDLIDRQKAEAEAKHELIQCLIANVEDQKAEIERLNNCVKSEDEVREIAKRTMEPLVREITREQIDTAVKLAKAEAYIEFVEMLKMLKKKSFDVNSHYDWVVEEKEIDNLLKELKRKENTTYDD